MNTSISPSAFLANYLGADFNPYASTGSLQTPYKVAASPFDSRFVIPGQTPNRGKQPRMPGEGPEIDAVYGKRIKGDAFNIGPGFTGLQLPPA